MSLHITQRESRACSLDVTVPIVSISCAAVIFGGSSAIRRRLKELAPLWSLRSRRVATGMDGASGDVSYEGFHRETGTAGGIERAQAHRYRRRLVEKPRRAAFKQPDPRGIGDLT